MYKITSLKCVRKLKIFLYAYGISLIVDCVWSRWFIGQCSKSCEGGDRTNVRYKEVVERYGGICSGEFTLIEPCNTDPCPGKQDMINIITKV